MRRIIERPAPIRGLVAAFLLCPWFLLTSNAPLDARDDATARDLRLGKGLYDQQLFERAIPPLERVRAGTTSDPERAESLFLLGEAYRSLDKLAEADVRFSELLDRSPRSEWAILAKLGRGEVLVRLDRSAEAVPLLRAATSGPAAERPAAQYWLAEAEARLGRPELAIAAWRAIVETAPEHELAPFAAHNAALRLRDAGEARDGLALLDRLQLEKVEGSLRDRIRLLAGELALAADDPRRALREYQAIEDPGSEAAALAGQAWAAQALDDAVTLESARRRLAEKHPRSAERIEVDILYGSARAEAGDIRGTDGALASHGDGARAAEARFWRAWARRAAGRPAEAAELFMTVEGDGPWATRAVLRAEEEWRKAERWTEALAAAQRFVETWGDDPRAAAVVAGAVESSYRLGNDQRVLVLESGFVKRWPDDPLAAAVGHYAAESALRSDDVATAVTLFARLWKDPTRRGAIGPRYSWALSLAGGDQVASRIAALIPALEGSGACEAGILLGRAQLAAGDNPAALRAFRSAAESDPSGEAGARARLEVATLLGAEGGAGAEEMYRAVLSGSAAEPVRARARVDLATLLAGRGEDATAEPEFARYLEDHPGGADRADAWIGLAYCRLRLEDLDGALAAISGLRKGSPPPGDSPRAEALYLEGRVQQAKGDPRAATRAMTAYVEKHPDAPRIAEAMRELGRIAEAEGDADGARGWWARRLALGPEANGSDEALYRLAWLELQAGDADDASGRFRALIAGHPKSAFVGDAHFRLGEIAYEAEEYETARQEYRAAIASPFADRIAERAQYRIGWSFRRAEEWAEAKEAFEELVKKHPTGELAGEASFLAGDAAERSGDSTGELRLLTRFIEKYPNHERVPVARIRLAERRNEQEEWGEARALLDPLRTASLEEPWRARHRIALGRALTRLGSPRAALPVLTEALDEGGARAAEAQFEIGLAHRAAGDRDRAIEAFIHGPVLYPFKPWAVRSHLEAGRDLLIAGKRKEAERVLKLAIDQDSDGEYGREAEKMLRGTPGKDSF